jgi:hypothetical protein
MLFENLDLNIDVLAEAGRRRGKLSQILRGSLDQLHDRLRGGGVRLGELRRQRHLHLRSPGGHDSADEGHIHRPENDAAELRNA